MALLKVEGVSKNFGALAALNEVSFELHSGEILGIIGPNGSGKTTLFNVMIGEPPADQGEVYFEEKAHYPDPTYKICRLGLVKTAPDRSTLRGLERQGQPYYGRVIWGRFTPSTSSPEGRGSHGMGGTELTWPIPRRSPLPWPCVAAGIGPGSGYRSQELILLDENMAGLTASEIEAVFTLLSPDQCPGHQFNRGGTYHAGRYGHLPKGYGSQLRTKNRRRHSGGSGQEPGSDRGLPG